MEVSRDEVLNAIRTLSDELGRPPTSREFDDDAPPSTVAVRSLFDSWNDALEVAGYEPHIEYRSDEEIIDAIQALAATLGHPSTVEEIDHEGEVPSSVASNRFDSWTEALVASGLEPRWRINIPTETIVNAIQSLAVELDEPPTSMEMRRRPAEQRIKPAVRRS